MNLRALLVVLVLSILCPALVGGYNVGGICHPKISQIICNIRHKLPVRSLEIIYQTEELEVCHVDFVLEFFEDSNYEIAESELSDLLLSNNKLRNPEINCEDGKCVITIGIN